MSTESRGQARQAGRAAKWRPSYSRNKTVAEETAVERALEILKSVGESNAVFL
jgi:hypothetical protein